MNDRWGPIPTENWRDTPVVYGRCATREDVLANRAVFYTDLCWSPGTLSVPCCAETVDQDGRVVRIVVVQTEILPKGIMCGYRMLSGGSDMGFIDDLKLLPHGFVDVVEVAAAT